MKNKGFSLVELLVSISLISILSVVGVINYMGSLAKGRDAKRKADLGAIQAGLEMYRNDNGKYPVVGDFPICGGELGASGIYINNRPCDPSGGIYTYDPDPNRVNYQLCATLEKETPNTYCVTNP